MLEKKPIRTIVDQENGHIVGYACGNCGLFYSVLSYPRGEGGGDVAGARAEAERCHAKEWICPDCDSIVRAGGRWGRECPVCRDERSREMRAEADRKELERFKKAPKVAFKDYQGDFVYADGFGHNDGFVGTEDVDDMLADETEDVPDWVWGCTSFGLSMDAERILEDALSDHHEDAGSDIGDEARAELQKFLDEWCNKQDVTTYEPANLVVLLKEPTETPAPTPEPAEDADG